MEALVERAEYLLQYAREMKYKVMYITHHEQEGPFSKEDSLSQIIGELLPQE
jgi:hypothetical protein